MSVKALMPRSVLIRHFFGRFFDQELLSSGSEAQAGVIQIIALLAVPGFFVSMYMLPGYANAAARAGSHWQASSDRLFFLTYAMAATGFATVFEWERLFPDRRDFLILLPLPIRQLDLFFAKVASLGVFVGLFLLASNGVSFLMLPLLTSRGGAEYLLRNVFAHLTAVMAGGLFMALAFGALQGILLQIVPARAFHRVVPLVQMVLLALMIVSLVSFPAAGVLLRPLALEHAPALFWWPCFWFLGVYESLLPNCDPVFLPLARTAWSALLGAGALFAITYAVGYWRHARRILESPEDSAATETWISRTWTRHVTHRIARNPYQRAVFSFIGQTLLRSPRHRLLLATQGGLGLAFGLSLLIVVTSRSGHARISVTDPGMLSFCMSIAFFVVAGSRAAFQFPAELRANWVFQLAEDENRHELLTGMRKWIWFYAVVPTQILLFILKLTRFAAPTALGSAAFELLVSLLLAELFFLDFRKAPFTCSYFPGKTNLAILISAYVYGFTFYAITMADGELYLLQHPLGMVASLIAGAGLLAAIVSRRNPGLRDGLTLSYEDQPDPLVRSLHLR